MIGLLAGGVTKLLGSSKEKPSGKKMASSIVKREPEKQQDKPKVTLGKKISTTKLLNLKPLEKDQKEILEKKSDTGTKLDPIFNTFNESLSNILSTLITTNTLKSQNEKVKSQNEKKKEAKNRERSLESRRKIGGMGLQMKTPKVPFGDAISNYFKNILIGSLILFLLKQYKRIKKFVTDIFDKVKEIFESLKPILEPMWNSLKWLVSKGIEIIKPLINIDQRKKDDDNQKIEKDVEDIDAQKNPLLKMFDDIKNFALNVGKNIGFVTKDAEEDSEKPKPKFADLRGGNENVDGYGRPKTQNAVKPSVSKLFGLVSSGEGGLDSVNYGTTGTASTGRRELGKSLTEMTVDEVYANQYPRGKGLGAVGKYQIIPDTMPGFIAYLKSRGIDTSKRLFNEATQDLYRNYTLDKKRAKIGRFLSGDSQVDLDAAQLELAAEFASVGVPYDMKKGEYYGYPIQDIKKGQSLYTGIAGNRADPAKALKLRQLLKDIRQQASYERVSNNVILVPTPINNSQPQTASAGSNIPLVATMSNHDILRTYHNGVVNNAMYKVG